MAATALLPGLLQINAWDTAHLGAAAASWTTTAETWEDAFTTVYRQAPFPGGTAWEGDAADAAVLRIGSDGLTVLGAVDALHDAASVARSGASDIQAARQVVIAAVREAQAAGFTVGADLSVTSRYTGGPPALEAARRAQAEGLAATIRSRAAVLAAVEEQVELNHKCDSLFERHPIRSEPGRTAERETVNPGCRQPHLPSGTTAEHTRRSRHQADQNRPGRQGRARQT